MALRLSDGLGVASLPVARLRRTCRWLVAHTSGELARSREAADFSSHARCRWQRAWIVLGLEPNALTVAAALLKPEGQRA